MNSYEWGEQGERCVVGKMRAALGDGVRIELTEKHSSLQERRMHMFGDGKYDIVIPALGMRFDVKRPEQVYFDSQVHLAGKPGLSWLWLGFKKDADEQMQRRLLEGGGWIIVSSNLRGAVVIWAHQYPSVFREAIGEAGSFRGEPCYKFRSIDTLDLDHALEGMRYELQERVAIEDEVLL